jgi:hypothetical protein
MWVVIAVAVLAVVVGLGWVGVQVWSQLSLIRSNRSLAKSYQDRAAQLRDRS